MCAFEERFIDKSLILGIIPCSGVAHRQNESCYKVRLLYIEVDKTVKMYIA